MSLSTYRLKIVDSDTPAYPFCNIPFTFPVYLVDDKDQLKCGLKTILEVKVYIKDASGTLSECDSQIFEVINAEGQLIIEEDGKANITVKINDLSMNDNRKFVVSVLGRSQTGVVISPAYTNPMLSIRYHLEIVNKEHIMKIWHKDEGGRENCLEVFVRLVDSNSNISRDNSIYVKLVLLYENGEEVPKQDILRTNNVNHTFLMNGQISIKFRIDQVSKNHQKKSFKIKVVPDIAANPRWNDISSDCSDPIQVRSKRSTSKVVKGRTESDKSLNMDLSVVTKKMLRWKDVVMNGVNAIEWKLAGYDVSDCSKPLYFMTNPHSIITAIRQEYHNQSLDRHLHALTSDVKQQRASHTVALNQFPDTTSHNHSLYSSSNSNGMVEGRYQNSNVSLLTIPVGNTSTNWNNEHHNYSSSSNNSMMSFTIASAPTVASSSGSGGSGTAISRHSNYFGNSQISQLTSQNVEYAELFNLPSVISDHNDNYLPPEVTGCEEMQGLENIELVRGFTGEFKQLFEGHATGEFKQLFEGHAYFIYSKTYYSRERPAIMGWPVYDNCRNLIGFYREDLVGGQSTLKFYSINSEVCISKSEIDDLTNMLVRDMSNGGDSDSIIDINNFDGDLVLMKKHVLSELQRTNTTSSNKRRRFVSPKENVDHAAFHTTSASLASGYGSTAINNNECNLRDIAKRFLRWKDVVMNGLNAIEWKLAGYEIDRTGVLDRSKPLYFMTSPLPSITAIRLEYHNQSLDRHLHALTSDVKQQLGSHTVALNQFPDTTSHNHSLYSSSNSNGMVEGRYQNSNVSLLTIPVGNTSTNWNNEHHNYSSSSNNSMMSFTSANAPTVASSSVSNDNLSYVNNPTNFDDNKDSDLSSENSFDDDEASINLDEDLTD